MNKGCIYWDESSRGIRNGKQDCRGRWCAEKRIGGRLVRLRSSDMQRCLEFLKDCEEVTERRPSPLTVEVGTIHDSRFMVNKNHVATMEQREQLLRDRIFESQLTMDYFKSRDFAAINRHVEKTVLPRINIYCTERLRLRKEMQSVVLTAVAILYTYLHADVPVFGYEYKLKAMLRYYKVHGSFGFYDTIPEPVHQAVELIDVSALEKRFVVKKNK